MSSIIDIVASLTLRAAIVIAILNMTIALQGKLGEKTAQANMFSLITTVARIISNDLNLTGNQVSSGYLTSGSSSTIIEVCYVDPSNNTKTWVKYFAGTISELSETVNPRDRKLYRGAGIVGAGLATPLLLAKGVDSLKFTYYNLAGAQTAYKDSIKSFSVYLVMATGDKVNGLYPSAQWTYRFFPSNIN